MKQLPLPLKAFCFLFFLLSVEELSAQLSASSLVPADDATDVSFSTNLTINFAEPVTINGSVEPGDNLVITRVSDGISQMIPISTESGLFTLSNSGQTLTYKPSQYLWFPNTPYRIEVEGDGIQNSDGDSFTISGDSWTFTIEDGSGDSTPPAPDSFFPEDDALDISASNRLFTITYDENVRPKNLGSVNIIKIIGGTLVNSLNIFTEASFDENTYTFDFNAVDDWVDLEYDTDYTVTVPGGIVEDAAGNTSAALGSGTWNFRTEKQPLELIALSPANSASNVAPDADFTITFNQPVSSGIGNVTIYNDEDEVITLLSSNDQISTSGNTITFDFPDDLPLGTELYANVSSGFIRSAADASVTWEGIQDRFSWTFITEFDIQKPSPISFTPSDDAMDVSVSTNFVVLFDEELGEGEDNTATLSVFESDGTLVQQYLINDPALSSFPSSSITVNTDTDLAYSTAYYVTLDADYIEDEAGNGNLGWSDDVTWNFVTEEAPDSDPPTIVSLFPTTGSVDVSVDTDITIEFSEPVKKGSGNFQIQFYDTQGIITQFDVSSDQITIDNELMTIDLNSSLPYSSRMYVNIFDGFVLDLANNPYVRGDEIASKAWEWTTEAAPDTDPPTITNYSPAQNATDVSINTSFVLTYNEPITSTMASGVLTIRDSELNQIGIETAFDGNTFTLTPTTPLEYNETYEIIVASSLIQDLAGNRHAGVGTQDWLITTEAEPDTEAPIITNYSPTQNATDVSINTSFVLTYNEPITSTMASGVLTIRDSELNEIDIESAFDGNTFTLTPLAPLEYNETYEIIVTASLIQDLAGNRHVGVGTQNWLVTTEEEPIATVTIPDANFKAALLANTALNTTDDGEISVDEAAAYTQLLDVSNQGISDLTGIEAFTALTQLNVADNNLETIDVSASPELIILAVFGNQLTTIDVTSNTKLLALRAENNQLTSILFDNGNTELEQLVVNDNNLTNLDVSMLASINVLLAQNNNLSSLNLGTFEVNELIDPNVGFDIRNNPELTCISIENVAYANTNLDNRDEQMSYVVSCDDFVTIPDANFKAALLADVTINTTDDGEISFAEALAVDGEMDVADQGISSLIGIAAFENLTELEAQNNNLTELDLSSNTKLTNLTAFNNEINSLNLSGLVDLTSISMNSNDLSEIDVSELTKLEFLILGANSLTAIDLSNNPLLEWLNLQGSQISTLDLTNMAALRDLRLSNGSLTALDLSQNVALQTFFLTAPVSTLDLSNNIQLKDVRFNSTALQQLDFSNNDQLTTLFVNNSNSLQSLNIQNGNNMALTSFQAQGNSSLTCIEVDDPAFATINFTSIDDQISFSLQCNSLPSDISLSESAIRENNAIGDVIGNFTSVDEDDSDTHTYQLVSGTGDDDNASFIVNADALEAAEVFDFEAQDSYSIRIETNDGNGGTFQKAFLITIDDRNEAPSDIALSATSINENNAIGDVIGTFSSTDPDTGDSHTYSFNDIVGGEDNASFTIDGDELKAAQVFDFEIQSTYSIRVISNDGKGGTWQEIFAIAINNVNENVAPTDIALSASAIDENNAIGDVIGTLTSTDANAGDTHTYSLVSGTGGTDNASFTIDGDALEAAVVFDFEAQDSYSIRVKSNDGNGGTFQEVFTITINDVNENVAPTDIILSANAIDENNAIGDVIGTLTSTDANAGDVHTYSLVSGNGDTDNASFTIDGEVLEAAEVFDFETQASYSIRVETNDENGGTFQKVFTITINDLAENVAPTDIALSATAIDENNIVGGVIGTFTSTDANSEDLFTYSLTSGAGDTDNASFIIDGDALEAAVAFDFETQASYSIRVETNDGNGGTFQKEFTININDVAENAAPVVGSSIEDVEQEVGFESFTIDLSQVFIDADGDALTFTAVSSNSDVVTLAIENGADLVITEAGVGASTISVTANDGNGGSVSDEFAVTVSEAPLGLEEELDLQVYPNPAVDFVNIRALQPVSVELSDLNGRMISRDFGGQVKIDVRALPAGVYLLTLRKGNELVRKRIIK